MRKLLGHAVLGENGTLYFWREDRWIYPEFTIDAGNGESASISLQHMSTKHLHELAEDIKRIAIASEKSENAEKLPPVIPKLTNLNVTPPPEIAPPGMPW